jgi:hypothetical protein
VATIEGSSGVLESNIKYQFSVSTAGDIPSGGYFTLYIPNGIGVPTSPATGLIFECLQGCVDTGSRSWSASNRLLTFNSVFPDS